MRQNTTDTQETGTLFTSRWLGTFLVFSFAALSGCQRSNETKDGGKENTPVPRASQAGAEGEPATVQQTEGIQPSESSSKVMIVAKEAIQPHMVIGPSGGIYVVCIQNGNISVCVSHDRGQSFSEPVVAIDLQGRGRGGAHRGPRIGVDREGNLTVTAPVTFDEAEYEKRYPTADLFFVRSTDGGTTWTKPVQVNEVTKRAPEALHWMAVAPTGEAHVAWLDMRDRDQAGQDIFYATIIDGEVSSNTKIATTVCECCAPGLAVDATGNSFVAYREGGDKPSREIFAQRSTDGGRSFLDPVRINKQDTLEHG